MAQTMRVVIGLVELREPSRDQLADPLFGQDHAHPGGGKTRIDISNSTER